MLANPWPNFTRKFVFLGGVPGSHEPSPLDEEGLDRVRLDDDREQQGDDDQDGELAPERSLPPPATAGRLARLAACPRAIRAGEILGGAAGLGLGAGIRLGRARRPGAVVRIGTHAWIRTGRPVLTGSGRRGAPALAGL